MQQGFKNKQFLPSFARQRSRKYESNRKLFLETSYIPSFSVKTEEILNFSNTVMEIGCGNGETAINFCSLNQNTLYFACEVFKEGLIQMAGKAEEKNINNIRFFSQDARELLLKLENSLNYIFLFFPDPWHKKRHHKRRILQEEFLMLCKKALKKNGTLLTVTDSESYKEHIEELGKNTKTLDFKITQKPQWWVQTKYENKAIKAGRLPIFYSFINL